MMKEFPFKSFFLDNVQVKIISLIMAVFLWFYIRGVETITIKQTVPVEVKLPPGMMVSNINYTMVTVELQGPREHIMSSVEKKIKVIYSFSDAVTPGKHIITLMPVHVMNISHDYVSRLQPAELTIVIDKVIEKELMIIPKLIGEPAEGVSLVALDTNPLRIRMRGARNVLTKRASIATEPIDVTGRKRSFLEQVSIAAEDTLWPAQKGRKIEVVITLQAETAQRVFKAIPIRILMPTRMTVEGRIDPSHIDITVSGSKQPLQEMDAKDIRLYVDVTEFPKGHYTVPVSALVPSGMRVVELSQKNVDVLLGLSVPAPYDQDKTVA